MDWRCLQLRKGMNCSSSSPPDVLEARTGALVLAALKIDLSDLQWLTVLTVPGSLNTSTVSGGWRTAKLLYSVFDANFQASGLKGGIWLQEFGIGLEIWIDWMKVHYSDILPWIEFGWISMALILCTENGQLNWKRSNHSCGFAEIQTQHSLNSYTLHGVAKYYCIYISTSSSRASRGRKFQKKKKLYSKEMICLGNVRKATNRRDAQTISLLWASLVLFHGGDVTCFDVMKLLAGWDEVM